MLVNFLLDTEVENGRQQLFNFQISKLDTNVINKKPKEVFKKLDSAAKINIALGFALRNTYKGENRYFHVHENKTLFIKSHLLCAKSRLDNNSKKSRKI